MLCTKREINSDVKVMAMSQWPAIKQERSQSNANHPLVESTGYIKF